MILDSCLAVLRGENQRPLQYQCSALANWANRPHIFIIHKAPQNTIVFMVYTAWNYSLLMYKYSVYLINNYSMHTTTPWTIVSHVATILLILGALVLLVFTGINNIWILVFFLIHRYVSVFFQSFFHHRYAAHAMFVMKKWRERFFYFFAWVAQGTSFMVPSAYAILHRMHHRFSDTIDDPHSPLFFQDVWGMMKNTSKVFTKILKDNKYANLFAKNYPTRKAMDKRGYSRYSRVARWVAYITLYVVLGAQRWMYLLLPIHFLMGPVHGAIVNRAGHMIGYRNHKTWDHSKNTLAIDFLTAGELFQNNHHNNGSNPKFANKRREIDPTYLVMRVLARLRIIRFTWK